MCRVVHSIFSPACGVRDADHIRDLACSGLAGRVRSVSSILHTFAVDAGQTAYRAVSKVAIYKHVLIYYMAMKERQIVCSDSHPDVAHARLIAEYLVDGVTATRMADLFKALADPTRVRIIGLLASAEVCVGDLCLALGMSQPAVSHHLKLLRMLQIVKARKNGQHVFYSLLDEHVSTLFHQAQAHVQHG